MSNLRRWSYFILAIMASVSLTGCVTPPAEQVLPSVPYSNQIVMFHSPKEADLIWKSGKIIAADGGHAQAPPNGGILGALMTAAIDNEMQKRDPARFSFSYGKAQQAIFMTSLCNNLKQTKAFPRVNLIHSDKEGKPGHIQIVVHFVKSAVGKEFDEFPITLSVDLTVKNGQSIHRKILVVDAKEKSGFFSSISFLERQKVVSQKLMDIVMSSLSDWNRANQVR